MGLYQDWLELARMQRGQQAQQEFWKDYFAQETEVYKKLLDRVNQPYEGKMAELAKELDMDPVVFAGFIDGMNTSFQAGEYDLESLEAESDISLTFEPETLYYNMLDAKADWLYNLPQWDDILTHDERDEIAKRFRKDKTFVTAERKIGRNEPCPCGSGKKYKACHGKPGAEPLEATDDEADAE